MKPDKAQATLTFRILRRILRVILYSVFKIEIVDANDNPAKFPTKGGYILAANHLSWLDPFMLLAFAPASPRIYFVADKKNMVTNAFRRFMTGRIGGVILVEPGKNQGAVARDLVDGVTAVLEGGGVFGIFPEGRVPEIETGDLLPFKKGVGHFALANDAPILPVALGGTKELYWRKRVRMVVGDMLDIKPFAANGTGRAQAEAITRTVEIAIADILPEPEPFDPFARKIGRNLLTNLFASDPVPPTVRMDLIYQAQRQQKAEIKEAK